MSSDPALREEAFPYFANEATDLLQNIEQDLLSLREDRTSARVHSLMRYSHTLKGAAATVGLETVKHVAHVLEDVFRALYNPDIEIDDEVEALLFEGYDCLRMPLMAELQGGSVDESDIFNRAAAIISRLQEKLGDLFDRETPIPTAQELGFDVVKSMFEVGVEQRLNSLEALVGASATEAGRAELAAQLQITCEVFQGLAESLQLPGFGEIAQVTLAGLAAQPGNRALMEQACVDLRAAQQLVLGGDRQEGGRPSPALLALVAAGADQAVNHGGSLTEAGLAIAPGLPDDLNLSGLEGLFGGLTEAAAPLAELEPALGLDGGLDGEAAPIAGAVTGGDASLPRLDGQLESQLESLFGQAELSELAPKPLADSPEPEPAPLPEALTSLDDLFGGLAASEIQDMFTNEEPVIAAEADDEGEVSGQDAIATPASVASTTDLDSSPAEPPASLAQEAAAIALSQAAPTASPAIVNVANDAANDAANTPASTPARRRPTKAATLISSSPARFNRGRESKVNLRVGLDQVLRLDHLVGELLTNQIQSSDQDDQLRQGVLELLDQLRKHRRTLSDLQTAAQQVGLDEWGRSSPAQDEADALVRPAMTATKRKQGHSSTAPGRGKGQRQSSVVHRAIAIPQLPLSAQFDALEMDRYSDLHIVTQKALNEAVQLEIVIEAVAEQTKQSRQTCDARQRLFRQLRDDLSAVRLKAVGELFDRFPRVLQQLSTTYGKQVELNIIGRHVLVDKVTLDALYDSLLHLVRNAFDHGIGTAAERQAVGKRPQGQIELAAYQQGNRTVIEVRDDGRGVNLERIAEKAIAQGLISATEVESITESQLLEFLFHPGFSTAASVSELSGRGVGLDVVRSQIEALEGNLSIRSELGEGTSFILQFPLSVTITKQLICMAGGTTYAIAADGIEQVLLPRSSQLRSLSDGRTVLTLRQGGEEAIVPVLSLDSLIGNGQGGMGARVQSQGDRPTLPMQPILLVNCSDGLRGIQVEQVMGEQELSIRAMGSAVEPPAYIQGCTVLGDAHLALVIEPSLLLEQFCGPMGDAGTTHSPGFKAQLLQTASASDASDTSLGLASSPASSSMPGSGRANQPQRILIIDDSLTQRRTLERTLNTVGYEVSQAEDGLDAIVRLQQNAEVDLIVCDLEMPRMNGFEFLSQSHSIPGLHGVPIVILTSRSGGKYRQLAQELGAAEFLSKPYTDYELLNTVAQLLKSKVAV